MPWFVLLPLSLSGVFLLVIMLRAALFTPPAQEQVVSEKIALDEDRLARSLQAMVRIPTISYAENGKADQAQFDAFHGLLKQRYPLVFERCSVEHIGKNGLLFHLPGKQSLEPCVLMAHYDVVPVEEARWTHPPFEGLVLQGELWGRGTLDTKCTVMGILEAAEHLLKQGFTPNNDLYLSFGGDEECLGADAAAIVETLKARGVKPAFVLDEGGAIVNRVFPGVSKPAALIGIAEKGNVFVDITARGTSGHASAPPAKQVVGTLARALVRIDQSHFPFTLTKPALELFDTLGRHSTFLYKIIFKNLWCFAPLLNLICRKSGGELNALVRTTAAQSRLSASKAYNVLPNEAKAGLNLRLIPGDSQEQAIAHLQRVIKNAAVEVSINKGSEPSSVSPTQGEAWERLKTAINATYPRAIVSPYLMVAASDSRHFCAISENVYRFSGLPLTREQLNMIHSQDERIPLTLLPDLVRFYIRVMRDC